MEFAHLESDEFQKKIYTGNAEKIDNGLRKRILAAKPDIVILTVPASELVRLPQFTLHGISPFVAEGHLIFEADLTTVSPRRRPGPNFEFRSLNAEPTLLERTWMARLREKLQSHCAANPYLHRQSSEQAAFSIERSANPEVELLWHLVSKNEEPSAICALEIVGPKMSCAFATHGSATDAELEEDVLTFALQVARERGVQTLSVSAPIQDVEAQKRWTDLGYRPAKAAAIVHLNLLMSDEYVLARHRERLRVTEEMIEDTGRATGDRNPVHFEDEAARAAGFEGRIAHGVAANGILSNLMGNILPGRGTIYMGQVSAYLAPIYPGREYDYEVAIKHVDREKNLMVARTAVYGPGDRLAFYGLATVRNTRFTQELFKSSSG